MPKSMIFPPPLSSVSLPNLVSASVGNHIGYSIRSIFPASVTPSAKFAISLPNFVLSVSLTCSILLVKGFRNLS